MWSWSPTKEAQPRRFFAAPIQGFSEATSAGQVWKHARICVAPFVYIFSHPLPLPLSQLNCTVNLTSEQIQTCFFDSKTSRHIPTLLRASCALFAQLYLEVTLVRTFYFKPKTFRNSLPTSLPQIAHYSLLINAIEQPLPLFFGVA